MAAFLNAGPQYGDLKGSAERQGSLSLGMVMTCQFVGL